MNPYFIDAEMPPTAPGDGLRRKLVGQRRALRSAPVQPDKPGEDEL